jgi:integrase
LTKGEQYSQTCYLNCLTYRSEILNLRWSNVDLANHLITVIQPNRKSKKERKVYINSNLKKLLLELKLKDRSSEFVFIGNNGLKLNNIRTAFNAACRRANVKGLRFHDLRHTSATRLTESGANIVAVSKILGHSDLKTTMRYTRPEDAVRNALENLSNFGKTTTNIATSDSIGN